MFYCMSCNTKKYVVLNNKQSISIDVTICDNDTWLISTIPLDKTAKLGVLYGLSEDTLSFSSIVDMKKVLFEKLGTTIFADFTLHDCTCPPCK